MAPPQVWERPRLVDGRYPRERRVTAWTEEHADGYTTRARESLYGSWTWTIHRSEGRPDERPVFFRADCIGTARTISAARAATRAALRSLRAGR